MIDYRRGANVSVALFCLQTLGEIVARPAETRDRAGNLEPRLRDVAVVLTGCLGHQADLLMCALVALVRQYRFKDTFELVGGQGG